MRIVGETTNIQSIRRHSNGKKQFILVGEDHASQEEFINSWGERIPDFHIIDKILGYQTYAVMKKKPYYKKLLFLSEHRPRYLLGGGAKKELDPTLFRDQETIHTLDYANDRAHAVQERLNAVHPNSTMFRSIDLRYIIPGLRYLSFLQYKRYDGEELDVAEANKSIQQLRKFANREYEVDNDTFSEVDADEDLEYDTENDVNRAMYLQRLQEFLGFDLPGVLLPSPHPRLLPFMETWKTTVNSLTKPEEPYTTFQDPRFSRLFALNLFSMDFYTLSYMLLMPESSTTVLIAGHDHCENTSNLLTLLGFPLKNTSIMPKPDYIVYPIQEDGRFRIFFRDEQKILYSLEDEFLQQFWAYFVRKYKITSSVPASRIYVINTILFQLQKLGDRGLQALFYSTNFYYEGSPSYIRVNEMPFVSEYLRYPYSFLQFLLEE